MPQFDDSKTNAKVGALHDREEERATQERASRLGYPYINLFDISVNMEALRLIDEDIARETGVALFAMRGKEVSLAIHNTGDTKISTIVSLLHQRGLSVTTYLSTERGVEHVWKSYAKLENSHAHKKGILDIDPELIKEFSENILSYQDIAQKVADINAENNARKTSLLISVIFGGALALDASDVHIEPEATVVRVRYRLDGVLHHVCDLDKSSSVQIISRLKLLAGVKLNIRKEAQDGRFTFDLGAREVEVRTSVIPGAHGESLVMRLLDPSTSSFNFEKLGLTERLHDIMVEELKRPHGAIFTTGPTGSGKTTALYSFLLAIHNPTIKIITLEDPVEYKLPGIVQTQITEEYTFENGLRSILRQDPDVILVGEIRDRVVAETAMHAALTGHLVFSTLHTNSAAGAVSRLVDMGVDTRSIISACNIILGQRLVRKLCQECRQEREITTEEQKLIQRILGQTTSIHTIHDPKGCAICDDTGYKGRIGVYEAIQFDKAVKDIIETDTSEAAIREAAKAQRIPSMQQDGVLKVLAGITSMDEVARVLDLYHLA